MVVGKMNQLQYVEISTLFQLSFTHAQQSQRSVAMPELTSSKGLKIDRSVNTVHAKEKAAVYS